MKRTILPAVLSLVLTGSLAFAQTATQPQQTPSDAPQQQTAEHHGHRHNPHKEAVRLSKKLNLTPDQTAKLEPILADRDQKVKALHQNTALTPDDRKAQMKSIAMDTKQQLSTILTPDQLEQMKAMRHHGRKGQEAANATTPNS
ncbi:hypothetical protein [Granulicella sibirica]|uniref:P pilus assembly/Cpx signaling pathway, periplasmic inhibitor/zinc-resistance associated protein n=1 Tax=Granulicella sibirica TaxID=2479048 RepID=A0A4Q0T0R3_9BACT|nr:hypothetical protein [Granulicella sibirica]RXH55920.1 hypothetical protein GRAN_2777 [Granulicella sibirica]